MTAKQIEEIRARAEKATKGPWTEDERYPGKVYCDDALGSIVADCGPFQYSFGTKEESEANTSFIAAAKEDVPALLADNDALRAEVRALRKVVEAARAESLGHHSAWYTCECALCEALVEYDAQKALEEPVKS